MYIRKDYLPTHVWLIRNWHPQKKYFCSAEDENCENVDEYLCILRQDEEKTDFPQAE